jgi:hypothetical protein
MAQSLGVVNDAVKKTLARSVVVLMVKRQMKVVIRNLQQRVNI